MPGKLLHTLSFILLARIIFAQTDSVKYTRDFVFKEGIYVTYQDFRNNKPNLTPENFKYYNPDIDYLEYNFFEGNGFLGHKKKKLIYPDSNGTSEIMIDSLYGYVEKNHLFIIKPINGSFAVLRVFKLGILSFCFESNKNYISKPAEVSGPAIPSSSSQSMADAYNSSSPSYGYSNMKESQFIMKLSSKKIYDYEPDTFERLLKKVDTDLYNEFSKLSRSKKKKAMFIYLNKVNDKHPIYFKN